MHSSLLATQDEKRSEVGTYKIFCSKNFERCDRQKAELVCQFLRDDIIAVVDFVLLILGRAVNG